MNKTADYGNFENSVREELKKALKSGKVKRYRIEKETKVSYHTMNRFIKGDGILSGTLDTLGKWLNKNA